jgi:hypothetical protein
VDRGLPARSGAAKMAALQDRGHRKR